MRNEAMFALEWVAYHRLIGFDHVFLCTNDCEDGTDDILDVLQDMGLVIHIRNDDRGDLKPQPAGVKRVLQHPVAQQCRWLLHIDADEYLNILYGDGFLTDWLPTVDPFDVVAITWRIFGDNGLKRWTGGLQTEKFTRSNDRPIGYVMHHKSMFRPTDFRDAPNPHMPGTPLRPGLRLCNAFGKELYATALYDPDMSHFGPPFEERNRPRHFRWEGAVINHYATRTPDFFLSKQARGSAVKPKAFGRWKLNSRWHRRANRNDVEETTILRHVDGIKATIAEWKEQSPILEELEQKAYARFDSIREGLQEHLEAAGMT